MVFQRSLSDTKSPQVPRTLLGILAVLNNAVLCMVSTRLPTSNSSNPFDYPLATVPKAPITIGIIVTLFHRFFPNPYQDRCIYPSFHFLSVLFCSQPVQQSSLFCMFSFLLLLLLLIIIRSGLLAEIR